MPLAMSVTLDTRAFEAAVKALGRPTLDEPVAKALRATANQARNQAALAIEKRWGIKSRDTGGKRNQDVLSQIRVPFVPVGAYAAEIISSKRGLALSRFSVRQYPFGVVTTAWGIPKLIKHAFIATMPKTGHRGVYIRRGKSRLPIQELFGPSVHGTFTTKEVADVIAATTGRRLATNLARQVRASVRRLVGHA